MMGNHHVRFLEEKEGEIPPTYSYKEQRPYINPEMGHVPQEECA